MFVIVELIRTDCDKRIFLQNNDLSAVWGIHFGKLENAMKFDTLQDADHYCNLCRIDSRNIRFIIVDCGKQWIANRVSVPEK